MLRWILRAIDRRIDGLEREVEALSRDLDAVTHDVDGCDEEIATLRRQLEHSVNNFAEMQVEHLERVARIERCILGDR